MGSVAQWTVWRRHRYGIAFVAGALTALAQAPWALVPLVFVGLGCLVMLLDRCACAPHPYGHSARVGAVFGFAYTLVGLHWVSLSLVFGPFPDVLALLAPVVAVGFAGVLCVFWAGMCCVSVRFWGAGPRRVLSLAVFWTLTEMILGWVVPWNLLGQVWSAVLPLLQGASWVGVYGLSFFTVLCLVGGQGWRWGVCVLLFVGSVGLWGAQRSSPLVHSGVLLRLVQPNIPQKDKWAPALRERQRAHLITLSTQNISSQTTHLIWPETALLVSSQTLLRQVREALPQEVLWVSGALRHEVAQDGSMRFFNSLYVSTGREAPRRVYDKMFLVPFGEYIPLWGLLRGVGVARVLEGFGVGRGIHAGSAREDVSVLPAPPFVPVICSEIMFSRWLVPEGSEAQWILELDNDAWFGRSSGPHQHLALARLRAVETGLPVVRVANTGVSALIDPVGEVVAFVPLGTQGVLEVPLPQAVPPPPYKRYGILVPLLLVLISCCFLRVREDTSDTGEDVV